MSDTRLKIAVQKSGRLLDGSLELLKECGIRVNNGKDQLKASASNYPVDILYLRNSDIPQYVQDGVADIGILGQNTLVEKQKQIEEVLPLGFSKCRLSIALPKNTPYPGPEWLNGKRIATSYPNSLRQFMAKHQIEAEIHEISGSVEIAPNIGLADAICDLVSSGSTLFKNGLEEKEVILKSEACIVRNTAFCGQTSHPGSDCVPHTVGAQSPQQQIYSDERPGRPNGSHHQHPARHEEPHCDAPRSLGLELHPHRN